MTEITEPIISQKYHKIIVPLEDIYTLGGPETFKKLERTEKKGEKNLLVIPATVFNELETSNEEKGNYGALDTAEFLSNHQKEEQMIKRMNELTIYRLYEGLDIALTNPIEQNHKNLEEMLNKFFISNKKIEFVTNNPFTISKLEKHGLNARKPEFLLVDAKIVNRGIITTSNDEFLSKLFEAGTKGVILADLNWSKYFDDEPFINQFINIKGNNGTSYYARITCDLDKKNGKIRSFKDSRIVLLNNDEYSKKMHIGTQQTHHILGITPLDMEQYLAFQYGLLNPDVSLLFLTGAQGSGKTLLSYVSAIDQILWYDRETRIARGTDPNNKSFFKKIVLIKPNNIMGGNERDIGYLPGNMFEKIEPHIMPFIDAHNESSLYEKFPFEEMLKHPRFENKYGGPRIDCQKDKPAENNKKNNRHYQKNSKEENNPEQEKEQREQERERFKINGHAYLPGNSEVIDLTHSGVARGRTYQDRYMLIDEAQNFTPYELKTLIQRAGTETKIIVMGDPAQLDNQKCTREINGLTHAIFHYLNAPYSCLINLTRNYRSQMSEDASSWNVYSH